MFDFDNPPSRTGTHAEKYTARKRLFGREDIMPFWVADMEFSVAPAISKALEARVQHPIYGYTSVSDTLLEAITNWNYKRYGLTCSSEDVSLIPGVMSGVSAALNALSDPGDAIIVQPPLYPPLMKTVQKNGRQLVENPLIIRDGCYYMNFDELEHLCTVHQPVMLLLCSPHNPVGRAWTRFELVRLVELAQRHNLYIVSDEIHADIIFAPHKHISALDIDAQFNARIIVLNSASKSFNIAGLNTAYAIIPDKKLRTAFRQQLRRMNLHGANLFGMTALEAAYGSGEQWLDELLDYLGENRTYIQKILQEKLSGVEHFVPQGTYLYWLDFNALGLAPEMIKKTLIHGAGVGLNDGITFARGNEGFWRFNFAVPRSMLEQGMQQIVRAFTSI